MMEMETSSNNEETGDILWIQFYEHWTWSMIDEGESDKDPTNCTNVKLKGSLV